MDSDGGGWMRIANVVTESGWPPSTFTDERILNEAALLSAELDGVDAKSRTWIAPVMDELRVETFDAVGAAVGSSIFPLGSTRSPKAAFSSVVPTSLGEPEWISTFENPNSQNQCASPLEGFGVVRDVARCALCFIGLDASCTLARDAMGLGVTIGPRYRAVGSVSLMQPTVGFLRGALSIRSTDFTVLFPNAASCAAHAAAGRTVPGRYMVQGVQTNCF
jgi:hypothetical protein